MLYLIYLPVLSLILLLYFRLADRFNIVDKPNHRSSHTHLTIRGGGIIFPIALLIQFLASGFDYPLFISGLLIISMVSFYDDLYPLPNRVRLLGHLIAVSLLFTQTGFLAYPIWMVFIVYILIIGTINAYNFMDGINGITVAYSLITLLSLWFINENQISFIKSGWLLAPLTAVLVFGYFNFRKRAWCFAGDVGSVSMAFLLIFFILTLVLQTGNFKYTGLFLLYGLDSVTTIIFRIIRRENIFQAHRSHFYQYLANVKGWPHLQVSTTYLVAQGLINLLIIHSKLNMHHFLLVVLLSGMIFTGIRFLTEGKSQLLGKV